MVSNFQADLAAGKEAEVIVAQWLADAGYQVEDVSNIPEFYYRGDLLITLPTGEKRFIEVKNDTVISTTGNILCEEEQYFKEGGYFKKGFMYNDYDIYAVVSQSENKIYFFDFCKMKEIYKKYGTYKHIDHPQQYSDCYLLEICRAKQFGALITTVNYQKEETKMDRIDYNLKLASLLQFEMEQLMQEMEEEINEEEC